MKKYLSLILAMLLVFSMVGSVSAATPDSEITISGAEILAVREMSNAEADQLLEEMLGTVDDGVTTYGTDRPNKNNVWDLSKVRYDFTVQTTYDDVFSNYVFSGHNGAVKFRFHNATSSASGYFLLRVYIRNFWNTMVYDAGVLRNLSDPPVVTIDGMDSDDLIYFVIIPDSGYTKLESPTYLCAAN